MPLDYRQVKDLYDQLASAGATTVSLPEWSSQMNDLTGTDLYSEGFHDNILKRASIGIDRTLEAVPGLIPASRDFGRSVGGLVGNPEAGASIGEGLPRITTNMLPYLIPGAGWGAAAARLGGAALMAGSEAYTKTDSPAAGLISGGTAAILPKVTDAAEQFVLGKMGARLVKGPAVRELSQEGGNITHLATDAIKRYYPETFGQSLASNATGQVAAAGLMEGGTDAQNLATGQPVHNPFTTEGLLNLTLGNLPFAAIHLGGKLARRAGEASPADKMQEAVDQANLLIGQKAAQDKLAERSDIEKVPQIGDEQRLVASDEITLETQQRLAKLRELQQDLVNKPEPTADDAQALNDLLKQDDNTVQTSSPSSTLGAEQPTDATKLELYGSERREHKNSRTIQVSDDPRNPEEFRGKTVNYSKGLYETVPTASENGQTKFSVPRDWHTILPDEVVKPTVAGTPDLPTQAIPATDLFAHISALDKVENDVEVARTPAQLQKTVGDLRRLRENLGLPDLSDPQLSRVMAKIIAKGEGGNPIKQAIKSEAAKTKRLLQAQQERQASLESARDWYSEEESKLPEDRAPWIGDYSKYIADLSKRGTRGSQLVASGQIHALAKELAGDPDMIERLKGQVETILQTGKGLLKIRPANEEVKETIKDNPDAEPQKNIVLESALQAFQNKAARAAFDSWDGKKDTNWDFEKEIFADWVNEFGPPSAEDIPDASEFFAERYARPLANSDELVSQPVSEWKDELTNFLSRPHVKIWLDTLNDSLQQKRVNAPQPAEGNLGDPARAPQYKMPEVWRPNTDEDLQASMALTGTGHTLVDRLTQSIDPEMSVLAKDLKKNFPEALERIKSGVFDSHGSGAVRKLNREIQIFLDPSVPSMWSGAQENLLMHELLHGLTLHELASPTVDAKVVQDLTNLRQRLVERLSPELRKSYDEAVASNWYQRYSHGDVGYETLHPDPSSRQVLYGLLNNDELVSQAFTSHSMRGFMRDTQSQGRKSAWSAFTGWVKSLLRVGENVKGTAMEEFLGLTSQLMNQGEFLSSFSNFGERYFESKGKGGSYGKAQTQRALGLAADSLLGTSRPVLTAALDFSASRSKSNPALVLVRKGLERATAERGEDYAQMKSVLDETGHKNMDDLVTDAMTEGHDLNDAIDLLPDVATNYLFEKLRDSKDVLDVLRAAVTEKNKGITNIADPKFLRGPVAETLKSVNALLKNHDRLQQNAQDLAGMSAVDPSGFMDAAPAMGPKNVEDFVEGAKDVGGKTASWLANLLEPMGQLARRVPEAAELLSKGFQLGPNSRKMFSSAMKVFGMDTRAAQMDLLNHESVQQSTRVFSNPKLLDAANKWIYLNNKKGGDSVQMLPDTDVDVAKVLQGLSMNEKADVQALIAKQGKSTQMMNAQKLEKMRQIGALNGAAIIQADTGAKTADNLALSAALLGAVLDSADPMKQPQVDAAIRSVQQRMQPEPFLNLLRYAQSTAETINGWKEYYDANPFWATAQRTERYVIKGLRNGKPVTLQASSLKEAKDIIEKKGITTTEPPRDNWAGKEDEPFQVPNMSPEMGRRMQELEKNQLEMLGKSLSPEDLAEVERTSAVKQIIREATATQNLPGVQAPPRLLSQGADELPWMWNHITWAQRESAYWSRQLLRAQARTYLNDPEVAANPDLQGKLKTHVENLLHPDPQVAQKMTRLASTWFLGYNLATSIINSAQPFTTHVAELTSISGKPIDSYKRVLNAMKEIGGHFAGRKDWASPEHEQLMQDAVHDGEIGIGKYDEEAAAQESIAENYKRAMMKNKPQDLGQKLGSAAGIYSRIGMAVFQQGEQINSRAAVLAAFDLYRDQGLSYSEAKQKAYEFNHAVNYSGGRAQRSVGAFSGRGAFPRTLAMLGTSLQSYVLGTTFQLARYLQSSAFRPAGATPAQVYSARKAAIQMLGTQFAAAGLLGLPFVSSAMALLNKLFPDAELNRKTRETVNGFLSSDHDNGSSLTDIAMTGVPSMLGWDLQSRLSMGNTLPGVSEVNGFQPENLLGPPANIVKNFVEGTTGLASGQASAGLKFLPPAIAKMVQAAQSWMQDNGNIRDYAGRPLANPTTGERLGSVIGFQPQRLSEQNSASRMLKQSEDVIARDTGQFHQQQAAQVLQGNFGTVRQAILERAKQNPDYNPVAGVRAISEAAEALSFPRDLRNEGSRQGANARASLLSSYAGVQGGGSELDRLQMRAMIQQKLGVAPTNLQADLAQASLIDKLWVAHPEWTRTQLRAAASDLLRRSSRGTNQLLPEGQ